MKRALLAALLVTVVASAACGPMPKPHGIILITLDTTRADHLGCYGYRAGATPNLDALASEAVRFEQMMASCPTTLPSHATMFTGLYPPSHGVRYNGMFRLADTSVTIAKVLRDGGFSTLAVPAAYPVYAKSGLAQGFDTYRDLFTEKGGEFLLPNAERPANDVVKIGQELIHGAGTSPFFIWLHLYDAHYPYTPPFPYSAKFREHPYDGEIAFVDQEIGKLFAALKKDGLWEQVAIIVAGDHGEGLYDHGERMHGQLAYQSTLRVPFLVKAPGARKGAVVREPTTLADVAPTILDLAGLEIPAGLDGISLKPALRGGSLPVRPLYFESLSGSLAFGWSPVEGVRRARWKLIRSKGIELYDLDADPAEKSDLATANGSIAAALGSLLDDDLARWAKSATPTVTTQAPVDADALARLASLGYIGGGLSDARRGGPNPKDLVHLESELLLLQDLMARRDFSRAMTTIPNLLRDDPANRLVLADAADASAGLRDFEAGERYAREVIQRYPEYLPAVVTLGRIQVAKKDFFAAEQVFRDGLKRFPDEPILVYSLALSLVAGGRAADAEPLVVAALDRPHPDPSFDVLHALCRAVAGDPAAATSALENGVKRGYKNVYVLRNEPLFAPLRKLAGFEAAIAPKTPPAPAPAPEAAPAPAQTKEG